jgi:hypothetical protein
MVPGEQRGEGTGDMGKYSYGKYQARCGVPRSSGGYRGYEHYFARNLIVRDPNWEADLPLHHTEYSIEDNTGGRRLAQPALA